MMTNHKWHVYRWVNHWVAQSGFRHFIADTWEEAMRYATDDKRDEIW
jgi:hypothetical protein